MITGIYKIENKINNKVYIGSSIDIKKRWHEHKRLLNKNKHHSRHLQNAYNKYGKENFDWVIILEVKTELAKLLELEQYYIDLFNACDKNIGYNISPTAGSCLGIKRSKYTCNKIKKTKTLKLEIGMTFGRLEILRYKGTKKKHSMWECCCTCGKIVTVQGTRLVTGRVKSCGCLSPDRTRETAEHNLSRTTYYAKWHALKHKNRFPSAHSWKNFITFKQDTYISYKEHCDIYGSKNTVLDKIHLDKEYSSDNFKWVQYKEHSNHRSSIIFEAISPDGEIIISNSQSEFARAHELHKGHINDCLKGANKTHKGWRFRYIN